MTRLLRAAWVIARRDYVATVCSRTFLLFLIGPLLPLVFGGIFGAVAARDQDAGPPNLAVIAPAQTMQELRAARAYLAEAAGDASLPRLVADPRDGAATLTADRHGYGLRGSAEGLAQVRGQVRLLLDEAARRRAGVTPAALSESVIAGAPTVPDRRTLARGAQTALFVLTIILAGMLISNLVEEKSSKVIEILAAAVPVDAIFLGKLAGMLAVSLTGIAAWGSLAAIGAAFLLPHAALPAPAIGWPLFAVLGIVYFVMLYLLLGALYLGIGAQAGSVREVQTLSLPLTMAQLIVFALGSAAAARPDSPLGLAAAILPWSSPFAMLARAAEQPALLPHLAALAWQVACLAIEVRLAARLFRLTVLKSGRGRRAPAQP